MASLAELHESWTLIQFVEFMRAATTVHLPEEMVSKPLREGPELSDLIEGLGLVHILARHIPLVFEHDPFIDDLHLTPSGFQKMLEQPLRDRSIPEVVRAGHAGPGVAVGHEGDECRIPDVVVTCALTIDETARLVPEPVIVIEVASPSTRLADVNDKVEFYGGIASIRHYLVIEQDRRRVVYHGRGASGGLEPRILRDGEIALDPPGIRLALDALYQDTELVAP
jgi:Putative restriction endonuclease